MRIRARVQHGSLPADSVVKTVHVREGISQLFDVRVVFHCNDPDLDCKALLWTSGAVAFWNEEDSSAEPRAFHGVIEEAEHVGVSRDFHAYRLRLRPRTHGLAYRVRSRIFQSLSAVDVIKQVLEGAGIPTAAVDWAKVQGEYPTLEYCVQWKESELAFVQRVLESEGIFYWFDHTEVDHVLHLGDDPSAHAPIAGASTLMFQPWEDANEDSVSEIVFSAQSTHDAHHTRDWSWQHPASVGDATVAPDNGVMARYEYPGGFIEGADGLRRAQIRLEEDRQKRYEIRGRTTCQKLAPGATFSLADVRPDFLINDYLLVEVEHEYNEDGLESGSGTAQRHYRASFRAIPADTPFRPPRITRKPKIAGVQSAVVTGPSGEEIHVDEFGRIKVHFYWDREGAVDDTATCWIRVQQMNTSGSMILPRVGWEVHVAFLDGDPDRPVALHKAYNQETMPPYSLPGNKTQSSLQSSTSPGGGSTNEIRLQDGNGGMELFMHSSKDLAVVVANNASETIAANVEEKVGADAKLAVGGNEEIEIGVNHATSVVGNITMETTGAKSVTVGAVETWGVTGNYTVKAGADRSDTIDGLMNVLANKVSESFTGSCTRTVGAVQSINAANAFVESVGGSKSEKVGGAKIEVVTKSKAENHAGAKVLTSGACTLKAGTDITLGAKGAIAITAAGAISEKCGDGFALTAKNILITAPGGATLKGGSGTFVLKGGTVTVDASKFGGKSGPMLQLKGPIDYTE